MSFLTQLLHNVTEHFAVLVNASVLLLIFVAAIAVGIAAACKLKLFRFWWWLWTCSAMGTASIVYFQLAVHSPAFWWAYVATIALLIALAYLMLCFAFWVFQKLRAMWTARVYVGPPRETTIVSAAETGAATSDAKYDPTLYFKDDEGFFVGLENGVPVYQQKDSRPMVLVAGMTGCGKGRLIQQRIAQSIKCGEAVIVFDPKFDEYLPHVCFSLAQTHGTKYRFVDLSLSAPAQFNPCVGATALQIEELFKAGAGLMETGTPSDFYLFADRWAAQQAAEYIATHGCTFADCWRAIGRQFEDKAPRFFGILRELSRMASINAADGVNLMGDTIEHGHLLYIRGSVRDDLVKRVQKMLLVRSIQISEARDRVSAPPRRVCLILDEGKHSLSKVALDALATIRDRFVHMLISVQSVGDFGDVSAGLNADAVKDAIMQNCSLQFVYRVMGADTADFFARNSGTKNITRETKTFIQQSAFFVERFASRSLRVEQTPHTEANELLTLANMEAIAYGLGVPRRVVIAPIRVTKNPEAVRVIKSEPSPATADSMDLI